MQEPTNITSSSVTQEESPSLFEDTSSKEYNWGLDYICPNCDEPYDGYYCENCGYKDHNILL